MVGSLRVMLLAGCAVTGLVAGIGTAQAGFQWTAPAGGVATAPSAPVAAPMARPAELPPRAAAAPVAPVMTESLPTSLGNIHAGAPIATLPDGPAAAAPIYGHGMTNDPITWNQPQRTGAQAAAPRAPQNVMPAEAVPLSPIVTQQAPVYPAPVYTPTAYTPAPVQQAPMMQAPVTQAYGSYEIAQGFGRDLPLVMAIRQIVPPQYGFVFADGIDVSSPVSWQGGQPWDVVLQNTLSPLGMTATISGNTVAVMRAGGQPMQMASATGPQLMTDTVTGGGNMMMAPTPVAMTAPATAFQAPAVIDDMGMGTGTAPGYVNAALGAGSVDLMANSTWTAPRASTLRTILEGWASRVGVELYWASEYDYPIQSAVSVQGTFEEAVQTLLHGLSESKPRPMGRLHPNLPNGPAVLVIETRQNSM